MWPNPAPAIVPPRADIQGFTALHAAALSAQGTMTMLLLDMVLHASGTQLATRELASMEGTLLVRLLKARDAHGRSAIHVAAGAANAAVRPSCVYACRFEIMQSLRGQPSVQRASTIDRCTSHAKRFSFE